ncbi:hypothetical protein QJQ45_004012 [Haematococcus lacustris]|nr:hypothetical protein QJQ45_004014 [Haematococcus lacustris]KAJ9517721.1 hypothetical protein QJQ45_004013 [Haematococcus lacustris]KAJ9517722.1 hypothetical protein QJQ45_004012 [Haematococcus lacustris]
MATRSRIRGLMCSTSNGIRFYDRAFDRELEAQPEPSQAQKNKKDSDEARRDRHDNNTWHAKKAKRHTVMRGVCAAGLEAGVVVASEVVEARLVTQIEAWVEACSMRALLGSLLLGLMVRGWFTRLRGLPDGQDVFEEIPAEDAFIPNLADRNMYLHLIRGMPPPGRASRPSEAVEDVLALYPGLHDRLKAVPRYEYDSNTVDDVGTKLETNFANSLTELFPRRVEQAVALAGARVIAGSYEHQRHLWLAVDGSPGWTERQRSWVARSVQGKVVTWLEGRPLALAYGAASFSGSGSIDSKGVPVKQMQREACKQFPGRVVLVHEFRTSRVSSARTNVVAGQAESFRWLHPVRSMATRSRIRGLMCSTSNGIRFYDRAFDRELEAQPEPSQAQKNKKDSDEARRDRHDNNTWHAKKAKRHTVMRGVCAAGLEAGVVVASEVVEARLVTQIEAWVEACSMRALLGSLLLGLMVRGWFTRLRGLPDGQDVFEEIPAEDAFIPNLADRNMYLHLIRGMPPPGRASRPSEAVEDVLALYPGLHDRLKAVPRYEYDSNTVDDVGTKLETNFANSLTELFPRRVEQAVALAGARVIAGSYEHQRHLWLAVDGSPGWTERQRSWVARSVQGKVVTWLEGQEQGQGGVVPTAAMQDETVKGARVRCNSAATGRPLALAYGAASFSGSGSIDSKGVPVKQMQREACKQFPGRVVLVHEFRTSRVSSARTNVVAGQAESFR